MGPATRSLGTRPHPWEKKTRAGATLELHLVTTERNPRLLGRYHGSDSPRVCTRFGLSLSLSSSSLITQKWRAWRDGGAGTPLPHGGWVFTTALTVASNISWKRPCNIMFFYNLGEIMRTLWQSYSLPAARSDVCREQSTIFGWMRATIPVRAH